MKQLTGLCFYLLVTNGKIHFVIFVDIFVFRFDTEVQKVNTVLLQEKQVLNKTQKERDEIISERFTLEQELKVSKTGLALGLIFKDCMNFLFMFIIVGYVSLMNEMFILECQVGLRIANRESTKVRKGIARNFVSREQG